jgi:hypothetical protein
MGKVADFSPYSEIIMRSIWREKTTHSKSKGKIIQYINPNNQRGILLPVDLFLFYPPPRRYKYDQ